MARAKPVISSFVAGELTPLLEGRVDTPVYPHGCRLLTNGIVRPHGGVTKAEGREFSAEVKNSANQAHLIPFITSEALGYVIEAGDLYFRFFVNNGPLGGPLEIVTPYLASELKDLQWAQSADVMFIVSPTHRVQELVRTSATTFTISEFEFRNNREPFKAENVGATTLTVTSGGGSTRTLTFSTDIGLTSGADVGRRVAASLSGVAAAVGAVYRITSVTSGAIAVATEEQAGTTPPTLGVATGNWALSEQSDTEGLSSVALHDGRLWFARGDRLYGSQSDDFNNFDLGTALDDESIARTLTGGSVASVQWLMSASGFLHIGGLAQEFFVRGGNNDLITPAEVVVRPVSSIGSSRVLPILVGDRVIHAQRDRTALRELRPGSRAVLDNIDLTLLSEHILTSSAGGVQQLSYAQEPYSVILAVRGDGELISIAREIDQDVTAPSRHIPGGSFQGGPAQVESVTSIPAPSGDHDQIWWIAKRTIDGATKRYVEFWRSPFRPALTQRSTFVERVAAVETAFFVDSGLSLDAPLTITSVTLADPVRIGSTAHGLSNGDRIRVREVVGTTQLNGETYLIADSTVNDFAITDLDGNDVNGTGFTAYITGGNVRKEVSTVSGLSHLEGETIKVLADGAPEPDVVVSSGSVTLTAPASIIHAGLGYTHEGETQRMVGGGRLGPGAGEQSFLRAASVRVYNTQGLQVGSGPEIDDLERINFRDVDSDFDTAIPVFSGDLFSNLNGDWNKEPTFHWLSDDPLPCTVLSVAVDLNQGELT